MKRGQIEHPINWILVLVAGAFFLILFVAITRTVIDSNEDFSEAASINTLSNILWKSKANVETLTNVTLPEMTTSCSDRQFIVYAGKQQRTFTTHALFAPEKIEGPVALWSEEFKLITPMTTVTYIFPKDTLYVITGSAHRGSIDKLKTVSHVVVPFSELTSTNVKKHSRVVVINKGADSLLGKKLNIDRGQEVHGIEYSTSTITFFTYNDGFEAVTPSQSFVSDEFLLAAIAAETQERYVCGRDIASQQAQFLSRVNQERIRLLLTQNPITDCRIAYERAWGGYERIVQNGLSDATAIRSSRTDFSLANKELSNWGCATI
jgi:hypothetical protein